MWELFEYGFWSPKTGGLFIQVALIKTIIGADFVFSILRSGFIGRLSLLYYYISFKHMNSLPFTVTYITIFGYSL